MNTCLQRAALISLLFVDCMCISLFVALPGLLCGEHKELVGRRWRIEESAEVYLNINSECGTGGMKDVEPASSFMINGYSFSGLQQYEQRFERILIPAAIRCSSFTISTLFSS